MVLARSLHKSPREAPKLNMVGKEGSVAMGVWILVTMFVLTIVTQSKSQLLTTSYHNKALIGVEIQPVLEPNTNGFGYLMGVSYTKKRLDRDYHIAVQSIKPFMLTGISYAPKNNHIYTNLGLRRRFYRNNHSVFDRIDIILQHEQFWNRSLSTPDLLISRAEFQLMSDQDVYGIEIEYQHETNRSLYNADESMHPLSSLNNWSGAFFAGKRISKLLFVQSKLMIGETRRSRRFTYKINSTFTLSKKSSVGLGAEYNKLTGLSPLKGFYFTLTANISITKELQGTSIAFFNTANGISASLIGLELKKRFYSVQLQYREIRDRNYKALAISDPFFASSVLLKVAAPIDLW